MNVLIFMVNCIIHFSCLLVSSHAVESWRHLLLFYLSITNKLDFNLEIVCEGVNVFFF